MWSKPFLFNTNLNKTLFSGNNLQYLFSFIRLTLVLTYKSTWHYNQDQHQDFELPWEPQTSYNLKDHYHGQWFPSQARFVQYTPSHPIIKFHYNLFGFCIVECQSTAVKMVFTIVIRQQCFNRQGNK